MILPPGLSRFFTRFGCLLCMTTGLQLDNLLHVTWDAHESPDVTQQSIDLIMTAPSVIYKVNLQMQKLLMSLIRAEVSDPTKIDSIEEPYVKAQIMVPQEFVGAMSWVYAVTL